MMTLGGLSRSYNWKVNGRSIKAPSLAIYLSFSLEKMAFLKGKRQMVNFILIKKKTFSSSPGMTHKILLKEKKVHTYNEISRIFCRRFLWD